MKLKTFKDLEFKPHPLVEGLHAEIIINGEYIGVSQGDNYKTYQLTSNRLKQKSGVLHYATKEQITKHLVYVQKHPKK